MADRELREKIGVRADRWAGALPRPDGDVKSLVSSREWSSFGLVDSRRLNERIIEALPLMLWILELDSQTFVYLNALTSEFLGYSSSSFPEAATRPLEGSRQRLEGSSQRLEGSSHPLEGSSIGRLIEPEDAAVLEAAVRRLAERRDGGSVEASFRVRHVDGTSRWLSTRISIFDSDGSGRITSIIGGSIDITASRQAEERISRLTQEASIARARERRDIASLLHDSIGQLLPVANARLSVIRDLADKATRDQIGEIQSLIAEAHSAASSLTSRLSPPTIHEIGLAAALQALAREIHRQHSLSVDIEIEQTAIPLSEAMEYTLYRVIRELLVNAAKHSGSHEASIHASCSGTQLEVVVVDAGVGFEPAESGSKGLGLRSAQDRLDYLGARMDIQSRPGAGTKITLRAPLLSGDSLEQGGSK